MDWLRRRICSGGDRKDLLLQELVANHKALAKTQETLMYSQENISANHKTLAENHETLAHTQEWILKENKESINKYNELAANQKPLVENQQSLIESQEWILEDSKELQEKHALLERSTKEESDQLMENQNFLYSQYQQLLGVQEKSLCLQQKTLSMIRTLTDCIDGTLDMIGNHIPKKNKSKPKAKPRTSNRRAYQKWYRKHRVCFSAIDYVKPSRRR